MSRAPAPRRRARTRWILIASVVAVGVVIGGAAWLEATHPQLDPTGNRVEGVPPLAFIETTTCQRGGDDAIISRIREQVTAGDRVSSTQVHGCPAAFDGLRVSYVGEVIGEVLPREGGAWAQVNDDTYALDTGPMVGHRERSGFNTGLSVWLDGDLGDRIDAPGRPALRGDVVLLTGTLLRADPDDGGGITLRATTLETLAPPLQLDPPLHVPQLIVAVVLGVLALTGVLATRVANRS